MSEAIREVMRARFCAPKWALCFEVQDATGMRATRSADAIAMALWPSLGLELIGFEFKVSRADWLRELKDPSKAETFKRFCDRWYLVTTSRDIVHPGELPAGWGWLVVKGDRVYTITTAPPLQPEPVSRAFLAALLRRADENATIDIGASAPSAEELCPPEAVYDRLTFGGAVTAPVGT